MNKNRSYAVWIPVETVLTLLGNWRYYDNIALPVLESAADMNGRKVDLPPDYRVIDATYSWERKAIGVRIAHESFPEVAIGEETPSLFFRQVGLVAWRDFVKQEAEEHILPLDRLLDECVEQPVILPTAHRDTK